MAEETTKILVPGRDIPTTDAPAKAEDAVVKGHFDLAITTRRSVMVGAAVRGTVEEVPIEDAAPDEIVELTYEDGSKEWMRVDALPARLKDVQRGGPAEEGVVRVPPVVFTGGSDRALGLGTLVLKGLDLLGINPIGDLTDKVADAAADMIVPELMAHYEEKLFAPVEGDPDRGVGLHPVIDERGRMGPVVKKELPLADKPHLILLHGTFSTAGGSFGRLFDSKEWRDHLFPAYEGRIYALDHRTVTVSPGQNALDLVKLLPERAKLHLVSYSRGGLVGEMLARGPATPEALASFKRRPDEELETLVKQGNPEALAELKELESLAELSSQLAAKQFNIERYVRAACPARGTWLASDRLDKYLSVMLNLIGLIPAVDDVLVYPFAKAMILSMIKQKADPKNLPGLEAMIPDSPYVRFLNRAAASDADLAVIAGDIEGRGPIGWLGVGATNLFFREEHDLVVNTDSMFEGVPRKQQVHYSYEQGPKIHHFNYFKNDISRARVKDWLLHDIADPAAQQPPAGFKALTGEPAPEVRGAALRSTAGDDAPVVFVLPSVLGTHLNVGKERIWLDLENLAAGRIGELALNTKKDKVVVGDLVDEGYNELLTTLAARFQVVPFPYDWRKSLVQEGERLAGALEAELRQPGRKVHILAHGSGGLLARAMMVYKPETWQQIMERGGRLLMLGAPLHGTLAAYQLLTGQSRVMRMAAMLDAARDAKEIARIFRTFPGVLELLPDGVGLLADGDDLWDAKSWMKHGLASEDETIVRRFERAERVHNALKPPANIADEEAKHICCVVSRIDIAQTEDLLEGDESLDFGRDAGEGLCDAPTWFMSAPPGAMIRRKRKFRAYMDLLERGATDELSRRAIPQHGVALRPGDEGEIVLFPTRSDLVNAAFGRRKRRRPEKNMGTLRISVAHGSLEHAHHPVAVGHYLGDVIVGSEGVLDRRLGGVLSRRYGVKLYPGPIDTADIVLTPDRQPSGGLIVGLGNVGELTPEILTKGMTTAALRYALALLEVDPSTGLERLQRGERRWRSAAFSSVLIGTNAGRGLSVESSVAAIVQGALLANRLLREQGLWNRVRIDAVEFVEIYEDQATRAARAVSLLRKDYLILPLEAFEELAPEAYMQKLEGGLPRGMPMTYDGGWWRRVQVSTVKKDGVAGGLEFVMLTDRARAEQTIQATQIPLINRFVEEAITRPDYSEDLHAALYELLLPNSIKDQALETANMVVVLDQDSANYPWEMLGERGQEPLAIRTGLLRQLTTAQFRTDVRAPKGSYALVIGDPYLGEDSPFPQLPGAKQEAEVVAAELERYGYEVVKKIDSNALEIVSALFAHEYRIIHIAAHGFYNDGSAKDGEEGEEALDIPTGVLIGDGISLTAAEIRQLRVVPELVFLNCCHLANIDDSDKEQPAVPWTLLASSVAQELIKIGVRAVIAAGWAVDDAAADQFAVQFYGQMLGEDKPFGEAVQHARTHIRSEYRDVNTWGAYQCYGMPSFTLGGRTRRSGGHAIAPVAKHEVISALKAIRGNADALQPGRRKELLARVVECERDLRQEWRTGDAIHDLAQTYADLGELETAIAYYGEALLSNDLRTEVPISTVEQLANLEARHAQALRDGADSSKQLLDEADALLDKSKGRLTWLIEQVGETPERFSLLGSCNKRIALGEQVKKGDVGKLLASAAAAYRQAYDLTKSAGDPYPALNWMICQYLANAEAANKENMGEFLQIIANSEMQAQVRQSERPTFWERVHLADVAFYRALFTGVLEDEVEALAQHYRSIFDTRSTTIERRSIIDHMNFICAMLKWRKEIEAAAAVERLRSALEL